MSTAQERAKTFDAVQLGLLIRKRRESLHGLGREVIENQFGLPSGIVRDVEHGDATKYRGYFIRRLIHVLHKEVGVLTISEARKAHSHVNVLAKSRAVTPKTKSHPQKKRYVNRFYRHCRS